MLILNRIYLKGSKFKGHSTFTSNVDKLAQQVLAGSRKALAQSITLVESTLPKHQAQSFELLDTLLVQARKTPIRYPANKDENIIKNSFRIGLSGSPGVGKSSFIETFGMYLIEKGYKVAVLAVDPSSSKSGGSILGDKTRMNQLSLENNAYIRPSPSSGSIGGVTKSTGESVLLCECAGFNIIIIETVGVGQSETLVASMVDMFVLLVGPGSGDELQGIKKGIVEDADLIVVNKADGDLLKAAKAAQTEYTSALKFQKPKYKFWKPKVLSCSSHQKQGFEALWTNMLDFYKSANDTNLDVNQVGFAANRQRQRISQMWTHVEALAIDKIKAYKHDSKVLEIEAKVNNFYFTSWKAATLIIDKLFRT